MVPVRVPRKTLSPSPRSSITPLPFQLTVAWPASMVFASASQKSPMLRMSRVIVRMMDGLNRTGESSDFGIGLLGRSKRDKDAKELHVIHVEDRRASSLPA